MACLVMAACLCGAALAQSASGDEPVKVDIEVSPNQLTGPQTVNVSIKVSNVSGEDLAGAVSLYAPNSKVVTDFGDGGSKTLKAGDSYSWSGTWAVTQKQLEDGQLTYQVRWPVVSEAGDINNQNKFVSYPLTFTGTQEGISVERTISPSMAKKGQEVSVTYTITNTGNVTVTSLKLTEHKNIAAKAYTFKDALAAGEQAVHTFSVKMGTKDLVSQGTVAYKTSSSNKTQTYKVDKATIAYGEPKLAAKLTASSTGVAIGDTVKLTLTLTNSGNVDYTNVKVTDPVLGEVFANQEVAAGETKILTKDMVASGSAEYRFNVTAYDSTNNEISLSTDKLTITAIDPNQKLNLTVNLISDKTEFYTTEDIIKFKVTVTNVSQVDCENVVMTAAGKEFYTFSELKAGDSKSFTIDATPSMSGTYQFVATTKDQLKNTVSFQSNSLVINQAAPTSAPTEAPARPVPTLLQDPIPTDDGLPASVGTAQTVLRVLAYVFGITLAIALGLLAVAAVKRYLTKKASESAYDHLERGTRRDYAAEPSEKKDQDRHTFPEEEEEDLFGIELPEDGDGEPSDGDLDDGKLDDGKPDDGKPDDGEPDDRKAGIQPEPDETAPGGEPAPIPPAIPPAIPSAIPPATAVREDAPGEEPGKKAAPAGEASLSQEEAAMLSGGDGSYRLSRRASAPVETAEPETSAEDFGRRRRSSRRGKSPTNIQG